MGRGSSLSEQGSDGQGPRLDKAPKLQEGSAHSGEERWFGQWPPRSSQGAQG